MSMMGSEKRFNPEVYAQKKSNLGTVLQKDQIQENVATTPERRHWPPTSFSKQRSASGHNRNRQASRFAESSAVSPKASQAKFRLPAHQLAMALVQFGPIMLQAHRHQHGEHFQSDFQNALSLQDSSTNVDDVFTA